MANSDCGTAQQPTLDEFHLSGPPDSNRSSDSGHDSDNNDTPEPLSNPPASHKLFNHHYDSPDDLLNDLNKWINTAGFPTPGSGEGARFGCHGGIVRCAPRRGS